MRPHRPARAVSPLRAATLGALALGTVLSPAPAIAAASTAAPGAAPAAAQSGGATAAHVLRHRHPRPRLVVRRAAYDVGAGGALAVRGTLLPRGRGRLVVVEAALGGRWRPVSHARTRANGHFRIRLAASWGTGVVRLRVAAPGGVRADAGVVRSYRATLASWYDLYGSPLACGGTLRPEQLGVANRTLPCGTQVTLRYRNRSITVPVIDRGPYVGGREWDLTGATARALGFDGVGVVWSTR